MPVRLVSLSDRQIHDQLVGFSCGGRKKSVATVTEARDGGQAVAGWKLCSQAQEDQGVPDNGDRSQIPNDWSVLMGQGSLRFQDLRFTKACVVCRCEESDHLESSASESGTACFSRLVVNLVAASVGVTSGFDSKCDFAAQSAKSPVIATHPKTLEPVTISE